MTFTGVNTTNKINSLSVKNKKRLDYKQVKISGDYRYSSDEKQKEQGEQKEQKEQEKQEKQDKKLFDLEETIDAHVNEEIFKNILNFKSLALCIKFCAH